MIKRLFWDIEVSPNLHTSWRAGYNINLSPESIVQERAIICIGYKWEHESEVHCLKWDKYQSDTKMLEKFVKVLESSEEAIAHNGDKFDLRWFRTRCIINGVQVPPDIKTIDTLKVARKNFYFNSNKLDYLHRILGGTGKISTSGQNLWDKVTLDNDREALALMVEYCKRDVLILQEVYEALVPYIYPSIHAGVHSGGHKYSCGHCGSAEVHMNKHRVSAAGTITHALKCTECGRYTKVSDAVYKAHKKLQEQERLIQELQNAGMGD